MPSGLVLVDKPQGFTSHDVVAKLRRILGTRKIGHAGTLDPMATGLLLLGVDSGTKLLHYLVGADKSYQATIRLGQATNTDDAEGEVISQSPAGHISRSALELEIKKLTGPIQQVPTQVSAIKVNGKRAYDLARAGEQVELKARGVTIYRFEILGEPKAVGDFLDFDVSVDCSSGTYIRALARDIGAALGVGGHLTQLRRIKIGNYDISQASDLEQTKLLPLGEAALALFPKLEISPQQEIDLRHGKRIQAVGEAMVAAFSSNRLVAILEKVGGEYRSQVVFPQEING